jgi:cellulose synthase (UDP-forming)
MNVIELQPPVDVRLAEPTWEPNPPSTNVRVRTTLIALVGLVAVTAYLIWLLRPSRVGNPALFGVLIVAELFNVFQALGFWWTCVFVRRRPQRAGERTDGPPPEEIESGSVEVDVFIPTYDEPEAIVEATVAAAVELRGARVKVALLDDGNRAGMERLAKRHGARYVRRTIHQGAKAGNVNHALGVTDAPFVVVLDCDHVPHPDLLVESLPRFGTGGEPVAFVQTPQYYANAGVNRVAEASWAQQSLFFGPIALGKDERGAMFCCGTNVVFRRRALESVGGFPETSVTEDFELSISLHEQGWTSAYAPRVLANGLGPEDLGSYVSQQHRWARGCIGAIPRVLRSSLRPALKLQYLLSASYFLTGWTVLVYLSMPVARILTGAQPIAGASADGFLAAFAPYFGLSLLAVVGVGAGTYTFAAYALATSTFWVHIHATCRALFRRPSRFVVTPKSGSSNRQWRAAAPVLVALSMLLTAIVVGLLRDRSPATMNNVGFALFHVAVLSHGVATAIAPSLTATAITRRDSDAIDIAA